ncbi:MAG: hypothetical protein ACK4NC_00875 [Candidatus Gracilibacteria bacterium]
MKYIQKIKKSLVVVALSGMLFFGGTNNVQQVYAAATPVTTTASGDTLDNPVDPKFKAQLEQSFGTELANTFTMFALTISLVLKYLYVLLMPLLAIIGKFMSNDWVTGNVLNVDIIIEVAWSYIRNLVNVAMMFYLLFIAGSNILFGYGGKMPQDAQNMPEKLRKVALVLILVNFSMLFCRTIINVSGVVTTGAFGIAKQSGAFFDSQTKGYFPFIWKEALGSKTTVVYKNEAAVTNAGSNDNKAKFPDTYALECIHKNYAVSLKSLSLQGDGGSIVIANPIVNDRGEYDRAWYHNYKILVNSEAEYETKSQWVKDNASPGAAGFVSSEQEFKQVTDSGTTGGKRSYPYYSDCVTDWNDLYFSSRNAMFLFAFNLMKIGDYESGLGNISSFSDLLSRVVISVTYLVVFFAVILALAVAVILRGIMLWFFMVMSPIWLTLEILGKRDMAAFKGKVGTMESFIKLAFMPAVLGFILSIVFLMINYLKYIGKLEGADAGVISLMGLNLYFDANNPIIGGLNSMFDMMIAIVTIVAVWFAVKTAFEFGFKDTGMFYDKVYKPTVGRILGTAEQIGKYAAQTPLYARWIPAGKNKLSFANLRDMSSTALPAALQGRDTASRNFVNDILHPENADDYKLNDDKRDALHEKLSTAKVSSAALRKVFKDDFKLSNKPEKKVMLDLLSKIDQSDGNSDITLDVGGKSVTIPKGTISALKTDLNNNRAGLVTLLNSVKEGKYEKTPITETMSSTITQILTGEVPSNSAVKAIKLEGDNVSVGGTTIGATDPLYTAATVTNHKQLLTKVRAAAMPANTLPATTTLDTWLHLPAGTNNNLAKALEKLMDDMKSSNDGHAFTAKSLKDSGVFGNDWSEDQIKKFFGSKYVVQ